MNSCCVHRWWVMSNSAAGLDPLLQQAALGLVKRRRRQRCASTLQLPHTPDQELPLAQPMQMGGLTPAIARMALGMDQMPSPCGSGGGGHFMVGPIGGRRAAAVGAKFSRGPQPSHMMLSRHGKLTGSSSSPTLPGQQRSTTPSLIYISSAPPFSLI